MNAVDTDVEGRDVAILGGGLAGLCLAIQLKQRDPSLAVAVLERRAGDAPEGAFKVGESTVEIGAHYFAETLGLRDHLEREQVRKFGFRFFFSEGSGDPARCTELGVSELLPTPSWQLDRGRFENFLAERARELGVDVRPGATVRALEPGGGDASHLVAFVQDGRERELRARWLVDASGRAGLLKHRLGLERGNDHDVSAAWWRVEGLVDPNAWSNDADWLARCAPPERWRSTNHLCGPGYWAWMIPLASGAHSIGIVADEALHPLESYNRHDKAMAWLREHQPRLAAQLDDPRHAVMDFRFLRHFSHGCAQSFCADRWAITGEAGVFLDPFYSPGSDFIAVTNTLACELIERDRAGKPFAPHAAIYQQLLDSIYDNTMTLYRGQYPLFGDAQVMPVKVIWDYTYYWSLLAPLAMSGRIGDVAMLGRLKPQFLRARELNLAVQPLLRDWCARNAAPARAVEDGRLLDQFRIDWFRELNRALTDRLDDDAFAARAADNVQRMQWLAREILSRARDAHPGIDGHGLDAMPDSTPAADSLSPAWYADAA
ncbi:MAG: tryptophan 7-halogenase [Lysobacterales bacterium]